VGAAGPIPLHALLHAAAARLAAAGIGADEARLDAEWLARHALACDRAALVARARAIVPAEVVGRFDALVDRRRRREPMGYVLGQVEFWGLAFEVGAAVLVPRPETETIVEEALARIPPRGTRVRVADIGTGSGCLAVSIAREAPGAHVVAIDISAPALAVAARNVARHGVAERVALVRGSLLGAVGGPLDVIVSNPPYVPDGDRPGLPPEVRDFEPGVALFGGPDGLDVIRAIVAEACDRLRPGGWLIFELGAGQAPGVEGLLAGREWADAAIRSDLQGIPRTAVARRCP